MPKFQIITAFINIAGNRDQVVYRGEEEPLTLPEVMVLRSIHGGSDHVHGLVAIGEEERDPDAERLRMAMKYGGNRVREIFPAGLPLPLSDASLPSAEEVEAAQVAATEAASKVRAKKSGKQSAKQPVKEPAKEPEKTGDLPDIDALPN